MTRIHPFRSILSFGLAAAAALLVAGSAQAQADIASMTEVEIDRDAADLKDEIRPRPKDIDVADTILTFHSTSNYRTRVSCVARDRSGMALGRAMTWVPANGVKYIRASDLSNGVDFVGSAHCWTQQHFLPAAIFLGPEITDLPSHVGTHEGQTNIRFPLVATY